MKKDIENDPNYLYQNCPSALFLKSGEMFDFYDIDPDKINVDDIAHGLSNICRFNGQTPVFYSVAEHCVHLVDYIKKNTLFTLPSNKPLLQAALLHDAAEAYIGDIIRPLKILWPEFSEIEERLLKAIFDKYGVDYALLKDVVKYDNEMTTLEIETMFEGKGEPFISFLSPSGSKSEFQRKFSGLFS